MSRGRPARVAWGTALLVVTVGPVALLLTMPVSRGTVSVLIDATGITATSSVLAALVLSSRLRSLTTTLGLERVAASHRYLGMLAAGETGAHVAIAVLGRRNGLALLNPLTASDPARAGLLATLALLALVTSYWVRRRGHEVWHRIHLAATAGLLVGLALHVLWLDHLIRDEMLGGWFEGAAGALVFLLVYRWLWRPAQASSAYTVRDVRRDSPTVSTLVLSPRLGRHREGPRTLQFEPGQFAWLRLRRFGGEEHPYSMSGTAHSTDSLEFTMRHTGDFTDKLAASEPGRTVYLDGPHGTFTPDDDAPGLVMIASGVGMTPILSMLRTLADRQDKRAHRLIIAAGTPSQLLFLHEIDALRSRLQLEVITTVRVGAPGWHGRIGLIDGPLLATVLPGRPVRDQFVYFVCGPPLLIADALSALRILRVPTSQIRTERFDSGREKARRERQHARNGPAHGPTGSAGGDSGRHLRRTDGAGVADSGSIRIGGSSDGSGEAPRGR